LKRKQNYIYPFHSGNASIIYPDSNTNKKVSVIVPIKNPESQEVVGVIGFDYSTEVWYEQPLKHTIHLCIISICLLLLTAAICIITNKNAVLKKTIRNLQKSEQTKNVLLSNLPGMAYRCNYDYERTMQFVSDGCFELTGFKPECFLKNEISYSSLICPEHKSTVWNKWVYAVNHKKPFKHEYQILTASKNVKWVYEQGQAIYDNNGKVEALEGLIIDITDSKIKEMEIKYLYNHDFLTGLYNRRFFEEEKQRLNSETFLPLSVIVGDINGVKIINGALGHASGDKLIIQTANILKSCCRENDVLARTGGDEFTILLPNTDGKTALEIVENIREACRKHNENISDQDYYIDISLGYDTRTSLDRDIDQLIRSAEESMFKRKMLDHKSLHSAIISSIKATMFAKSQETEEHAERLVKLSKKIGKRLNLSQKELDELELLAILHDIGKVGISDKILNKPGKLTDEEWAEIKRHPEIGYRIARSSSSFVSIAKYILSHHERWDGRGYPQGLKGEEIPLLSRILAVVDAYDAMTENRVYRKAISKQAAIEEIKRNAGTQFDPNIVRIFLEILNEQEVQVINA
jgi:diguanylate cyclase (GGDEF)-like protein